MRSPSASKRGTEAAAPAPPEPTACAERPQARGARATTDRSGPFRNCVPSADGCIRVLRSCGCCRSALFGDSVAHPNRSCAAPVSWRDRSSKRLTGAHRNADWQRIRPFASPTRGSDRAAGSGDHEAGARLNGIDAGRAADRRRQNRPDRLGSGIVGASCLALRGAGVVGLFSSHARKEARDGLIARRRGLDSAISATSRLPFRVEGLARPRSRAVAMAERPVPAPQAHRRAGVRPDNGGAGLPPVPVQGLG